LKIIVLGIIGLVAALLLGVMGDFTIPGWEGSESNATATANATADPIGQFEKVGEQFSGMYGAFLGDISSFSENASASRASGRYQSTLSSANQTLETFDNFSVEIEGRFKNVTEMFGKAGQDD